MRRNDIPPCTRRCAATGRPLEDGERIMSVVVSVESPSSGWKRQDFPLDVFQSAPEGAIAWWITEVPESPKTQSSSGGGDTLLLEILRDTSSAPSMRWDAAERLVRKRRVVLERPSVTENSLGQGTRLPNGKQAEQSNWVARLVDGGERIMLPPPVVSGVSPTGGGLLGGVTQVLLLICLAASGCASLTPSLRPKENTPKPIGNDEGPTVAQMVEYLNDNSRRINAIQCNQVAIDCRQGNQNAPGLDGMVVLQKPKQFRLKAKVLGQNAVDLGSNQEEFWYWVSKVDPPYVFHCSHAAMAAGQVKMPFPFQPEMIMAALGMAEYDPTHNYEVKIHPQVAELREKVSSPQGKTLTRVTVFQRAPAAAGKPQVLGHVLYDDAGREICSVQVQEVQVLRQSGAVLPQKVRFHWPDEKIEMVMRFGEFQSTEITPDRATRFFSRNDLGNLPGFDLARWAPDDAAQRTRGQDP